MSDCGFCHPPIEDSHDREVMDRFADFLRNAPPPGIYLKSAAARYRFRYLVWKCEQPIKERP
jgi:hypothetical protein